MKTGELPAEQRTLLHQIRVEWDAMVAADEKAERHRREVDRLMADAMEVDGIGARTIGKTVGVDHSNIVRRVQRHRRAARKDDT